MLRFCDKEIETMYVGELDRNRMLNYFLSGHRNDPVCIVTEEGKFYGILTYASLLICQKVEEAICPFFVIADFHIWEEAGKYFKNYKRNLEEVPLLPVLNREHELISFAYQDEDANRELRMLREILAQGNRIGFRDMYPEIECVTIYDCNELACRFVQYLQEEGVPVNVKGDMWQQIGIPQEEYLCLDYKNYVIYAEGVGNKSPIFMENLLHSVSVEFECIDKIYEENIRQGKITDVQFALPVLLEQLREAPEVILLGTNVQTQMAYAYLKQNGIDICGFLATDKKRIGERLFGRKIMSEQEAWNDHSDAVFVDVQSQYSAWGIGEVDLYDYMGFERNQQFFVLKDYVDNLKCDPWILLRDENVVLVGDAAYCSRISEVLKKAAQKPKSVRYYDIMNASEEGQIQCDDLCLLMYPEYYDDYFMLQAARTVRESYIAALKNLGIDNYTELFSDHILWTQEEADNLSLPDTIKPKAIVVGAPNAFSGNIFLRGLLDGHPNILLMNYCILNHNLFYFCNLLSGVKADGILLLFWKAYSAVGGEAYIEKDFCDRERFCDKMEELLQAKRRFSSQELFCIFHMAYAAMYGRELTSMQDMVIYWEPHHIKRKYMPYYVDWLRCTGAKIWLLRLVRNQCVRAGSMVKDEIRSHKEQGRCDKIRCDMIPIIAEYPNPVSDEQAENEIKIRFEDLKCSPKENLTALCHTLEIPWSESLMHTTQNGVAEEYYGVRDFDLKPVYNGYEEYLSLQDKARILILSAPWQRQYGYDYERISNYSRREVQELFLKSPRFVKEGAYTSKEQKILLMRQVQKWERDYLQRAWRMAALEEKR
jgi:hypothetical protein